MKILDNSNITNTAQLPIKKGTIAFLQDSHKETVISLFKAMVGSTYNVLTPYVLFGLNDSGSGLIHNISEGAIVILGEIYQVDAVAFTSASGEVPYLNFIVNQYTTDADPVTFTDLSVHDVHNIRKYEIVSATSGDIAFSTLVRPVFDIATETARAVAREDLLAASLIDIRSAWIEDTSLSNITIIGGTVTSVALSVVGYKQIGKTMHIRYYAICNNTTAPTGFSVLIPNSAQSNCSSFVRNICSVKNGGTQITGQATISHNGTTIDIECGALTNTLATEISGTFTFDTL